MDLLFVDKIFAQASGKPSERATCFAGAVCLLVNPYVCLSAAD